MAAVRAHLRKLARLNEDSLRKREQDRKRPFDDGADRPLFLSELNKQTPAGANYEHEHFFGSKKKLFITRSTSFRNTLPEFNNHLPAEVTLKQEIQSLKTLAGAA